MRKNLGRGFVLFILISVCSVGWSCNLPLDPKVFVVPNGGEEKYTFGPSPFGKPGPHSSVVIDEGQTSPFTAYIDITGKSGGLSPTTSYKGRTLITLPDMENSAKAKLKFSELMIFGGGPSNPSALSLGGSIAGMNIQATGGGGHWGMGAFTSGGTDLNAMLPNPGPAFVDIQGNDKWEVTEGKYKSSGKFEFTDLSSTAEFDLGGLGSGIENWSGDAGTGSFGGHVPTSDSAGTGDNYYAGVIKVDMTLEFWDITWTWKEQKYTKNASGTWVADGGASSYEVDLKGDITRTSDGGVGTGHPGYFYIKTKDITDSCYSRMAAPLPCPSGTTGDTLPGSFNITFDMVDNNPLQPTQTSIPVDFFYTLAVTDYKDGGYSTSGADMDKLKFAEYKDKIIWKKLSGSASMNSYVAQSGGSTVSVTGIDVTGIGKVLEGPLDSNLTRWSTSFTIPEKMGLHYAKESNDATPKGQGGLMTWEDGRLKYFVVPKGDGQGKGGPAYAGPALDSEDAGAKDGTVATDYGDTRSAFTGVTPGNPPESISATESGEDISKVVGMIGFWEVKDNDPPNLFLAIKDTRKNVTHIFGDNTSTIDSGTGPFTGYSSTVNNDHTRAETTPEFLFAGGDSADQSGYDAFQAKYSPQYAFHNNGDNNDGLWIDEDTKLEFTTWGYDNINTYNNSRGLANASVGGSGEPHIWWSEGMDFGGDFKVIDAPGGSSSPTRYFPSYIFRYPNRPSSLNTGDCSVEVSCNDGRGGSRKVKVNVYVIWNKKEIRSLEEIKYRK